MQQAQQRPSRPGLPVALWPPCRLNPALPQSPCQNGTPAPFRPCGPTCLSGAAHGWQRMPRAESCCAGCRREPMGWGGCGGTSSPFPPPSSQPGTQHTSTQHPAPAHHQGTPINTHHQHQHQPSISAHHGERRIKGPPLLLRQGPPGSRQVPPSLLRRLLPR